MSEQFFSTLNYSLANEDTNIEYQLVKKYNPKNIFSICGSGSRSLPLIANGANLLEVCDLSGSQLEICKLRSDLISQGDYQNYLKILGYPPFENHKEERKKIFQTLKVETGVLEDLFSQSEWDAPIYLGKWEKTFLLFHKVVRLIMRHHCDRIVSFDNLKDQIQYIRQDFPHNRWKLVLSLLGQKSTFNKLLYKGHFIEKNFPESHFKFYQKRFHHLFTHTLARDNFFLQLIFQGKISSDYAFPLEANSSCFKEMNTSLINGTQINYIQDNAITYLKHTKNYFDFVSLSDAPSYFQGDLQSNFIQDIKDQINSGGVVIIRYYLKRLSPIIDGFKDITYLHTDLTIKDKIGVYDFQILQKI